MAKHSFVLKPTKNRRVKSHVVAKKFGDVINNNLCIRPNNLMPIVRMDLGAFVANKVLQNVIC